MAAKFSHDARRYAEVNKITDNTVITAELARDFINYMYAPAQRRTGRAVWMEDGTLLMIWETEGLRMASQQIPPGDFTPPTFMKGMRGLRRTESVCVEAVDDMTTWFSKVTTKYFDMGSERERGRSK